MFLQKNFALQSLPVNGVKPLISVSLSGFIIYDDRFNFEKKRKTVVTITSCKVDFRGVDKTTS